MAELVRRTSLGTLHILGWRDDWMDRAAELGLRLAGAGERVGHRATFEGLDVYLKGGLLAGRASRRHALRARLLRAEPPRLAEYRNLCWLTERLFQTPLPIAAGALLRRGAPRYQFLLTQLVSPAVELGEAFEDPAVERAPLLEELAREVARMHALRFVHRDLFPRNVLVGPAVAGRRLCFLDAWRGGARAQLRGPAYDLACFYLHAPDQLERDEQRRFFERYASERARQGRPLSRRFARAVERERRGLLARLRRDPARLRGAPMPSADWRLDG